MEGEGRTQRREPSSAHSLLPSPSPPPPGYQLCPKVAQRSAGRRAGAGVAPRAPAFPSRVPHQPPAVPPPRLSGLLTSRPGRRGRGRRGTWGEARRQREGGGRAHSPSPELQNSPAASPRAPARRSVQPPASGESGARPGAARWSGRGALRAAKAGAARSASPCKYPTQGDPCDWGGGQGGAPSLRKIHCSSARSHGGRLPACLRPALDPGFHLPTPGVLPSPFAPRRAGKVWGGVRATPSPPPTLLPGLWDPGPPPSRRVRVPGALARVPRLVGARGTCCAQAGSVGPSWPPAAAAAPWRPPAARSC